MKWWLFLCLFLMSCGGKQSEQTETIIISKQTEANLKVLFAQMSVLEFEVVYESGAEPYTGNRLNGRPYWALFEDNVKEIFKERADDINFVMPKELNQMRQISSQSKSSWTVDDILELEKNHRQTQHSGNQGSMFVAFVKGYFNQGGLVNPNIIGVNLSGTTIIVVFKDVIKGVESTNNATTAKFMEQSTLVHEFGHVVGLVNNGLPMKTPHQDEANGHHCNNSQCVMYWKNEGRNDMLQFIQQYVLTGRTILFDQNCIDDGENYSP